MLWIMKKATQQQHTHLDFPYIIYSIELMFDYDKIRNISNYERGGLGLYNFLWRINTGKYARKINKNKQNVINNFKYTAFQPFAAYVFIM